MISRTGGPKLPWTTGSQLIWGWVGIKSYLTSHLLGTVCGGVFGSKGITGLYFDVEKLSTSKEILMKLTLIVATDENPYKFTHAIIHIVTILSFNGL